jgi:hypothetical protein
MLSLINNVSNPLLDYIKDDPVRPEIPKEFRVDKNKFVICLQKEDKPAAMVCVSLHDDIPDDVEGLSKTADTPTIAIFYTIWSYVPGAGAKLIFDAVEEIRKVFPDINRFVTLSPKTEMAKRFHLKNGAQVFRSNETTVNYEYKI